MWKFDIIDDFDKGTDFCHEQFDRSPQTHVFAHPALLDAWIKTYLPIRNLSPLFIKAENERGVMASLPLVLWTKNWKNAFEKSIVPIGYSDFDYHNPLFSEMIAEEELDEFWKELHLFLSNFKNSDSFTIDGITDSFTSSTLDWQQGEICPLLILDDLKDEQDLMAFFKSSLRGDIRRQMRRVEENIGQIELKEYKSFEEIPEDTFRNFMFNHSLRWPNAYKAPRFHENLLKSGLEKGCVHFSVLKAGDPELAWHLGFVDNGVFYYYMPAGNQEYMKYSPVKLHLFFLVRRGVEGKLQIFDHLRGEENYKQGWSNDHQYVNSFTIKSSSINSRIKHNMLKLKSRFTPPHLGNTLYVNTLCA